MHCVGSLHLDFMNTYTYIPESIGFGILSSDFKYFPDTLSEANMRFFHVPVTFPVTRMFF